MRLKPLRGETLRPLKPLSKTKYLSDSEMLLYSSTLCLYAMQLLRGEIQATNKNYLLRELHNEAKRAIDEFDITITKRELRENYKRLGISKPNRTKRVPNTDKLSTRYPPRYPLKKT